MEELYHIGFKKEHNARYALLPGDPGRVEAIARRFERGEPFARNREYTAYLCDCLGQQVIVMSTGMGGPSAAIAVEELHRTGVRNFLRVGTCGGMALDVKSGDIVIASAAIRMEGTSKEYVPVEFPAVAHIDITNALSAAADSLGLSRGKHVGIVHCKDSFYGQHEPARMPAGRELADKWDAWLKAGCLASEMESAALFIVAQVLGAKAGCVLNVVWNQERQARGLDDGPRPSHDNAIDTAVEAVKILIRTENY
ncbi:MAG: uridine phosphorylase [Clostridiales bacterium]|jgi:uridine phosphorylase|nr:uridine phosphorylase [Clostridiales bacterium]